MKTLLLTRVLAYKTRRVHHIVTETQSQQIDVCANRFGYVSFNDGASEPEWGILSVRTITFAQYEQMRYGNLCPVCNEWHHQPNCKVPNVG